MYEIVLVNIALKKNKIKTISIVYNDSSENN